MKEVEEELQTITKIKPKRESEQTGGSARDAYLQRLMDTVAAIPEDEWASLSVKAQNWYNEGAKALKAQKPIPDFDEMEPTREEPEEDDDNDDDNTKEEEEEESMANTDEDVEPRRKKKKVKTKAPAKAAPAKKGRTAVTAKGNNSGDEKIPIPLKADAVKVRIKLAILKDPSISLEDLITVLSKGGQKVSKVTTSGIRSEFRHSLRVLQQEGLIKLDI